MDKEQQKNLLIDVMEADEKDGLYKTNNMAQQEIKNDISVSSRLKYITDKDKLKVIDFIIDYSFKDEHQVYTNGTILVPLFRVLDAITQSGEPYQSN